MRIFGLNITISTNAKEKEEARVEPKLAAINQCYRKGEIDAFQRCVLLLSRPGQTADKVRSVILQKLCDMGDDWAKRELANTGSSH